jgi:small subunit ribosomal protein S1
MSPVGKKRPLMDEETHSAAHDEFAQLLAKYDYAFHKADIIKGRIVSLESNGALVDIGAKTAAFLPQKEIASFGSNVAETVKIGEEYDFYILREENEDGQLTLSRKRVQTAQSWHKLEEMMNSDVLVECTVTAVVKGGLLVDVMGLRGFVPSSHLRVKNSLEQMVNTTLPLKILSLDQQRNNIILSHRKVMSEQMAEQRKELFSNLSVGTVVEGEVVRLTEFGAFVDLGGVDGLLPLSQMSWRWVEHPSDILKIGDSVKVEVIGVDHDKQRVSLSIKSQFSDPWNDVAKEFKAGDKVEGGITRIKHFGAFVEIYPGVEALLPSKDLNDYEHQNQAKLEVGQKINTFIIKFTPEERRISLSFNPPFHMQQQMQPQPQATITGD